jgi:hypothetical protein
LDGIERFAGAQPESNQNGYCEHRGTPDTGAAMHPEKPSISYHFRQLIDTAQEISRV